MTTGRTLSASFVSIFIFLFIRFFFVFFPSGHTYKSTLVLYLLAEFHVMLTSSMTKNYIVLNSTFSGIKEPFLISGYTSVIHTISVRLR